MLYAYVNMHIYTYEIQESNMSGVLMLRSPQEMSEVLTGCF